MSPELTNPIGTGITVIGAGATILLTGVAPAGYVQRRSLTIVNMDTETIKRIQVRDSLGRVIGVVFKESTQIYYFSGACQIHNPGIDSIACHIGEIWYLPQAL